MARERKTKGTADTSTGAVWVGTGYQGFPRELFGWDHENDLRTVTGGKKGSISREITARGFCRRDFPEEGPVQKMARER